MSDLWERVEPLLARVERPSRYIDREWGAVHRPDAAYRVALMYPDAYEVGMANQALQVLAGRLATLSEVACERVFVPWVDMAAAMRAADVPLFTLESCSPVATNHSTCRRRWTRASSAFATYASGQWK